jgi:hypothetical protein
MQYVVGVILAAAAANQIKENDAPNENGMHPVRIQDALA